MTEEEKIQDEADVIVSRIGSVKAYQYAVELKFYYLHIFNLNPHLDMTFCKERAEYWEKVAMKIN